MWLTTERPFGIVSAEQMYAAGYGILPLRSRRAGGLRHLRQWAMVLLAVVALSLLLSKVALGGGPHADLTIVVQPGDTLWAIAAAHYPSDDVRARVSDIERANGLQSPAIEVGETLRLPA
jgi:nucleoid-associated protein YgaU